MNYSLNTQIFAWDRRAWLWSIRHQRKSHSHSFTFGGGKSRYIERWKKRWMHFALLHIRLHWRWKLRFPLIGNPSNWFNRLQNATFIHLNGKSKIITVKQVDFFCDSAWMSLIWSNVNFCVDWLGKVRNWFELKLKTNCRQIAWNIV